MGQAKKRGSFEARKAESIERHTAERKLKDEAEARRQYEIAKWREANPVESRKQEKRRLHLGLVMGAALAMSYPSQAAYTND
jgi:hypothetical protein